MWIEHLRTVADNRRKGAAKAAETRKSKQKQATRESDREYCGVCGDLYEEETEEIEYWIACDTCGKWFHWHCVNITTEPRLGSVVIFTQITFVCVTCT